MLNEKGNSFLDSEGDIFTINYEKLVKLVIEKIDSIVIKSTKDCINISNLDEVINDIIIEIGNHKKGLNDYLGVNDKTNTLSTNFKNDDKYKELISNLKEKIEKYLDSKEIDKFELDDLADNKKKSTENFGVDFDFSSKNIIDNSLSMSSKTGKSRLKLDIGTVDIDCFDLESCFIEKVKKYILENVEDANQENTNYIFEEIDNKKNDVGDIINLIESESISRIKRSLGIVYLEYLCNNSSKDLKFLNRYINRFYKLEEYIQKLSEENSSKNKFKIKNKNILIETSIDSILSQGNAFDELPIVAILNKSLAEKKEKNNKIYKFDLRLKLNGQVQSEKVLSLDYMLNKIINGEFEQIKTLRVGFLFIFLLNSLDNENYNPIEIWEDIFEKHKGDLYTAMKIYIYKYIDSIKDNTTKILKDINTTIVENAENLKALEYDRYVVLNKQILDDSEESIFEKDFDDEQISGKIFKRYDEFYGNKTVRLKHLSIVKNFDENKYLFGYKIKINISSLGIYECNCRNKAQINYELDKEKTVSVVYMPTAHLKDIEYLQRNKGFKGSVNDNKYQNLKMNFYKDSLGDIRKEFANNVEVKSNIIIPYDVYRYKTTQINNKNDDEFKNFEANKIMYSILYNLLSYLFVEVILNKQVNKFKINPKDIYINIIRQNIEDIDIKNKIIKTNMDITNDFIRTVNKNLEHILSNTYKASSQGRIIKFNNKGVVKENADRYKQDAALTSLYSKITKTIKNNNISDDKIAFIFVTSSISDRNKNDSNIKRLLIGEVVKFNCKNNVISCESFETFQENYEQIKIYSSPIILKDLAIKLSKDGYNKILFVSEAPYSTKLNMVSKNTEQLFFMNENVLRMMSDTGNLTKIYPVFFQQYYVYDHITNVKAGESLFLVPKFQQEYIKNSNNNFKTGFFNLYNGLAVGNNKNYKGIGMYSVIGNKYKDEFLNNSINELLNETSKTRVNIIECIKAFHLSRYEANKDKISIKLNPYEKLSNEKSIGKKSVDDYKVGKIKMRFNSIAFLNEVKKIIDKDKK